MNNPLIKEDKHNVRLFFDHGNPITLDLKGSGSLYIHPGKDYFFYNAPMKFIDYIIQLKRLGVTYKLTTDKKGCFMAVDLSNFESQDPRHILGGIRSNVVPKVETVATVMIDEPVIAEDSVPVVDPIVEPEDNTPAVTPEEIEDARDDADKEEVKEVSYTEAELNKLGKPALLDYAKQLGLTEVNDLMTKAEIKELIKTLNK